MKKSILLMLIAVVFNFYSFQKASAQGFDNSAIGLKSVAMGNAFYGIADDSTAVYYNPGGISFHKTGIWNAEIYTYYAPTEFKYTEDNISDKSNEAFIIPGLFISKADDRWSYGFGAYIPFAGGGTRYDNYLGSGNLRESYAGWTALTSALAYRINDSLSVGMGLSLYTGKMSNTFTMGGVRTKMKYGGFSGSGYHLGLMYKPSSVFSVGFTARSEVPIKMDGKIKIAGNKYDSEAEFDMPSSLGVGFGYKPASNLTFGVFANFRMYESLDKITLKNDGIGKLEQETNYNNIWLIGLGLEYVVDRVWTVRAGLKFDEGGHDNEWLNPDSMDTDLLSPSLGIGYKTGQNTEFNIVYIYAFAPEEQSGTKTFDKIFQSLILGCSFKF